MERQHLIRFFRKLAILAVLLLVLAIALLLTPISKEYAYAQLPESCRENNWQYHRLLNDSTPMDLVFIGSSHTMLAVNDSLLQNLLPNNWQVANIGFCRLGRDLQYTMLLDMLSKHQPKHVVIEVRKTENRFSHPDHYLLADGKTLLNPTPLFNQAYFGNLALALQARAQYWRKRLSGTWQPSHKPKDFSHFGWKLNPHVADASALATRKEVLYKNPKQKGNEQLYAIKYRYAHEWLQRNIDLLKQNGVTVSFLYLPDYGTPLLEPLDADIYRTYGSIIIPPQSILNEPSYWYDIDHLNAKGADTLTKWLAKNLILSDD